MTNPACFWTYFIVAYQRAQARSEANMLREGAQDLRRAPILGLLVTVVLLTPELRGWLVSDDIINYQNDCGPADFQ